MTKLGELFPDELLPKTQAPKTTVQAPRNTPNMPRTPGAPSVPVAPVPPVARDLGKAAGRGSAERVFVKDFVAGQEIEGIFLVGEATLRVAKNGSKYVQASFGDKSGSVPVRQWDATDADFAYYKTGTYIKIRGRAETYKNAMQMIVFAVQGCDQAGINAADFLPVSNRPVDEMEAEFTVLLETIKDPDYKRLLDAIFANTEVRPKFLKGPAAAAIHHAWVGGLAEHVLSACKTAQSIAEQRPFLNRDLLMTGVILHDIGKIEEISATPGFNYTDTGRLCGHIVLGALLVERHILKLENFPAKKRDLILHMILSHHGELEYGSPVTPVTAEAVALHHLECLDAKVQGIQTLIERDRASGNDGAWTDFARVVDGRIFKNSGS